MAPDDLPEKQTLPHLIRGALAQPREDVVSERVNGTWTSTSSAALLKRVENLACAIRDAGLSAGDRVALMSHNCVDWIVADFATIFAGCVVVPIYPTQALDHLAHILTHSDARLIFADSAGTQERLVESGAPLPRVVRFDSPNPGGLQPFENGGAAIRARNPQLPRAYEDALHPDDLAVLIYTSGTTGVPKGVMLSHDNLGYDARVALDCGFEGLSSEAAVLSVLPYSHIYEHTLIYIYLLAQVRYFICHDPGELIGDLRDVRPAEMTSVPRLFDRLLAGVRGEALRHGGPRGRLIPWALRTGRRAMYARVFGNRVPFGLRCEYALARVLVLTKLRRALGFDRVEFLTSGSAPLHLDTAMTLLGFGVPVMQGYGLTETSPIVSVSRLSSNAYGAVGRPLRGVAVRVAADGELLVRGRNVMHGYYRDLDATAAAIDGGWLHTGDLGHVDDRGFLWITDRKNEVFKTSTGKWISPSRVEASIKRSIFVTAAMVTGRGEAHPLALICPNWALLRLELPQLPADAQPERLAVRDDVREFLTHEVHRQTRSLASYEQVRHIIIIPREFSVEGGELSPSMKIKRRVVEERFAGEIRRAYDDRSPMSAATV
ncbi:MAG: long-chain fatty acid--CoA ligase [Candidatus Eremiobacteraeota bacterium]|nr:long-chain fatty acid--CoA ligase [Candidatus Eremiobacteraeota bacterium]MBV9701010.1 long-chain fatty acid--CoA ligase [Candidatus Eremiobacteraeota bacterium]